MSREIRIYCDVCGRFFHGHPNEKGESVYARVAQHGWLQNRDRSKALCPNCKYRYFPTQEFENEEDWKTLNR